jgi:hypothetical protein
MTSAKPFLKGLAVGLLAGIILALFFFLKAGNLSKVNADLKAAYDHQAALNATAAATMDKERAAWARDRAGYELAIAAATTKADELTAEIQKSKLTAAQLLTESEKLRAEVRPAIDANPQLKKYVDFILAGSAQKDVTISELEARDEQRLKAIGQAMLEVASWKKEAGSWKTQYQNEEALNMIGEKRISALTVSLRVEKLKWGVKGLVIGAAVPIAYVLIRGLVKKAPATAAALHRPALFI